MTTLAEGVMNFCTELNTFVILNQIFRTKSAMIWSAYDAMHIN
jgi:hypothetical protein